MPKEAPMTHDPIHTRVRRLGRLYDDELADRLIHAAVVTLGEVLPPEAAAELAARLPEPHRGRLSGSDYTPGLAIPDVLARIAERAELGEPQVRDLAPAVFGAVAETVGADTLATVTPRVAEPLRPLLAMPDPDQGDRPAPYYHPSSGGQGTLATGRLGGGRTLSEGRPVLGHANSIARAEDPRGDTKLSGARGISTEREGRTLAAGRPGHGNPISGEP